MNDCGMRNAECGMNTGSADVPSASSLGARTPSSALQFQITNFKFQINFPLAIGLLFLFLLSGLTVPRAAALSPEERLRQQREAVVRRIGERKQALASRAGASAQSTPAPAPGTPATLGDVDRLRKETVQGVLYPGESYTYKGVTMTWKISDADKQTSKPLGYLSFTGPKTIIPNVPVVDLDKINRNNIGSWSFDIFLDGAYFSFDYNARSYYTKERKTTLLLDGNAIGYRAGTQPDNIPLNAAPARGFLYLSAKCPVTIGPWKLSVSEAPVTYPGGAKYHQLSVLNATSGTSITIPATQGSLRKVDRFTINVDKMFEKSATVALEMTIDPDPRPLGGDSYGTIRTSNEQGGPIQYGDYFKFYAEKFKFNVEWVAFPPSHPESIDYAKNLFLNPRGNWDGIIKDNMNQIFEDAPPDCALGLEWTDTTHLRVWAKNYDKIVAEKEKLEKEKAAKAEKEAREKAAEAERQAKVTAAKAQELKAMKEKFAKDYTPVLQIYPLNKITPVTARVLIEPELSAYFLADLGLAIPSPNLMVINKILERTEYTRIVSVKLESRGLIEKLLTDPTVIQSSQETVVADDKAGAVIVKAIPATQARVKEILAKMDGMIAKDESAEAIKQYRIEVILLAGVKEEKATEKAESKYSPMDPIVRFNGTDYVYLSYRSGSPNELDVEYMERDTSTTIPKKIDVPIVSGSTWHMNRIYPSQRGKKKGLEIVYYIGPLEERSPDVNLKPAASYGISPEDLKVMGLDKVKELGRGVVALAGQKGDLGKATLALNASYRCQLEYQDLRRPYLIVKGSLLEDKPDKPLLSNTMFLEPDKPTLLGLTNLKEALILLVKQTK